MANVADMTLNDRPVDFGYFEAFRKELHGIVRGIRDAVDKKVSVWVFNLGFTLLTFILIAVFGATFYALFSIKDDLAEVKVVALQNQVVAQRNYEAIQRNYEAIQQNQQIMLRNQSAIQRLLEKRQ